MSAPQPGPPSASPSGASTWRRAAGACREWTAVSLPVAARVMAAVLGGYMVAHALPIALAAAMPIPRSDAALYASQGSFLVYTAAAIWAFAARSAPVAWLGLLGTAGASGLIAWVLL